MQKAYIVGFDPGFANIGISLVELTATEERVILCKTINTKKMDKVKRINQSNEDMERARSFFYVIVSVIEKALKSGTILAFCTESISTPRNAAVARKLGMFFGGLSLLGLIYNVPVLQATPKQLKLAVSGSKKASKEEIITEIKKKFPDVVLPKNKGDMPHAADSLGAVFACLQDETLKVARTFFDK